MGTAVTWARSSASPARAAAGNAPRQVSAAAAMYPRFRYRMGAICANASTAKEQTTQSTTGSRRSMAMENKAVDRAAMAMRSRYMVTGVVSFCQA